MLNRTKKQALIVAGAGITALLGVALTQGATRAEVDAPSLTLGTYDPGQVAQQTGMQQKLEAQFQGLQQRMMEAQQEGDQEAMQRIQGEAQTIQQGVIAEFEASVDAALPTVAEGAGIQVVAVEIAYAAPGIETKDITNDLISEMGGAQPDEAPSVLIPPQQ